MSYSLRTFEAQYLRQNLPHLNAKPVFTRRQMTEYNRLDQFFEECVSTQIGSITLQILQHQAGDDSVSDKLWQAVIGGLRERAAEVLARYSSTIRNLEPDDLINERFEVLSRILAGEVVKIKHREDFFSAAYRNFNWYMLDLLKKKSRLSLRSDYDAGFVASDTGPEEKAERMELYIRILEESQNLPEDLLNVFNAHFVAARSFREIEGELGIPKSTAEERWARARRLLIQKLEPSAGISSAAPTADPSAG